MITEKCRVFLVPEAYLIVTSIQHLVEPLDIPRCFESFNQAVILPFHIHFILRVRRMSMWPKSCAMKVENFMERCLQAAHKSFKSLASIEAATFTRELPDTIALFVLSS